MLFFAVIIIIVTMPAVNCVQDDAVRRAARADEGVTSIPESDSVGFPRPCGEINFFDITCKNQSITDRKDGRSIDYNLLETLESDLD